MDHDRLLDLLLETMTLKRMPRTGWAMRGVSHVESVAEHSLGVAVLALWLAQAYFPELDSDKVLRLLGLSFMLAGLLLVYLVRG